MCVDNRLGCWTTGHNVGEVAGSAPDFRAAAVPAIEKRTTRISGGVLTNIVGAGPDGTAGVAAERKIAANTPEFRRANLAVFSCGFPIFAVLYCTQPVLPLFAAEFGVSPAESSLALSLTTITMAVAMLFASSVSEALGRRPLMSFALVTSSLMTLALAFAPDWQSIVWLRALSGVALSGAPAVTLAWLGEEMEKDAVPHAVGIYIGGGALGGMSGRLVAAFLADFGSWRWAMAGIAITGLVSAILFWRALPASRHFHARPLRFAGLASTMWGHVTTPAIALLVVEGFILLGSFMNIFNYIGFRLQDAPFGLSQAAAGLVFLVYPIGSYSSAFMGKLAGRHGRGKVLTAAILIMLAGLVILVPDNIWTLALGLAVLAFGFFGAHSISSGWAPALAARDKAQASSLYLLLYYIGGGVAGSIGGVFWSAHGWNGVTAFSAVMMLATLAVVLLLARIAPVK